MSGHMGRPDIVESRMANKQGGRSFSVEHSKPQIIQISDF